MRCAVSTAGDSHTLRVGYTLPTMIFTAFMEDDVLDLTDVASVTFKARRHGRPSASLKIERAATILEPRTSGRVRVDWIAGDVDVSGEYDWWIDVLYNDGKNLPVPNPGYGALHVVP